MCFLPKIVVNHFCGLMSGKAGVGSIEYFIPSHREPNGDTFINIFVSRRSEAFSIYLKHDAGTTSYLGTWPRPK
jgi:hypothetical protein